MPAPKFDIRALSHELAQVNTVSERVNWARALRGSYVAANVARFRSTGVLIFQACRVVMDPLCSLPEGDQRGHAMPSIM